jgi:cation transporter-like permease
VATLVGAQIAQLGLFARTYAVLHLGEEDALLERGWQRLHLEQGAAVGGIVLVAGVALLSVVVGKWIAAGFGALHLEQASVLALTLIGVGIQVLFGSFFLSILSLGPSPRD